MDAVLWDLDGTLVDTEPYWIETEFAMAGRYGATWSQELALDLIGSDLLEAGRFIGRHMGLDLDPAAVVEELLDGVVAKVQEHVPWRPGARELLTALVEAGVPCGLVTMSYERFAAPILAELSPNSFGSVVTGEKVRQGKPHPEPYLTAATALGVAPGGCVAIEDSNTGATSAEAAGCTVLVVENHVAVAAGPARVFRDSLVGLTVTGLRRLVSGVNSTRT